MHNIVRTVCDIFTDCMRNDVMILLEVEWNVSENLYTSLYIHVLYVCVHYPMLNKDILSNGRID